MKISYYLFALFSLTALFMSCDKLKKESDQKLFELLPSGTTGIDFSNNLVENDTLNAIYFEYLYNGGGVAVGDINNDGLSDIYFTGNMVSSKLYLNKGNFEFEDITQKSKAGTNRWSTGVSMVDINSDGFLDIYVSVAGYKVPKEKSGNLLFINNGDNTFTESASKYGIADEGYNTHGAFFDYDKDGDLDLYVLSNALEVFNRNNTRKKMKNGEGKSTDKLYRNNGNGTFSNVSREAGILIEGYGLGVAAADINLDGWPDLYVANDFLSNDLLYINNGNGTFTNKIAECMKHQSHNGMGTDIADYNNDGFADIMVLDMLPEDNKRQKTMFGMVNYDRFKMNLNLGYEPQYVRNSLQLNNGNGTFSEVSQLAGVSNTDWSWSPLFADYDNDGFKDLLITNGYRKDVTDLDFIVYKREISQFGTEEAKRKQLTEELKKLPGVKLHNYIYKNNGDLTFLDQSNQWGLADPSYSNGAAFADLDNDGDLDLVINNIDEPAFVYRNNAEKINKNKYLRIKLNGSPFNPSGIGAKIKIQYKGKKQFQEQIIHKGYKSSVEPFIHFGTGQDSIIDTLEITWPDGKYQLIKNVKANQVLAADYKNAVARTTADPALKINPLLKEVAKDYEISFKYQEMDFIDFKIQSLLHQKHSQNGPGITVGDIDGNGLDDFFIGGPVNTQGTLFIQNAKGKFKSQKIFAEKVKYEEDMGVLLFDADNDNDLDLYVVSGSTEYGGDVKHYQDRLYRNNSKGEFLLDTTALPKITASGSCVVASDFDKDGDLDLFIGGRVSPGKYPYPAESYLLKNNKGKFSNATAEVCKELQNIGMVTAALWTDFDNDHLTDLIIVGEGMPVTFFKNSNGRLINVTKSTGLPSTSGWWNSLTAGDFDNDGDIDYAAGNLGTNTKYKASENEPVCVYANDYDKNGSVDPVLCYYIQGKNYPAHPRDLMIDQMVFMRRKFLRYTDYANATFDEVFTKEEMEGTYILRSDYFKTSFIENLGNGKFAIRALPIQAQIAPVFGMISNDYDNDGNLDLLLTGNSYASEVQSGLYDASIGLYLKGDGKGNFSPMDVNHSGFFVNGDAKGIAEISTVNGQCLTLAAVNSDSLKVFSDNFKHRIVKAQPGDSYAVIKFKNSKSRKQEFYYGSAYLSQSSRMIRITDDMESVLIYDDAGKSRSIR
jgi:enediyne biosynthesis protein E4